MTIAVACNLADGVVMGVDSALTIHGAVDTPTGPQNGIVKVYNDAEKLFPLHELPLGIATYGIAVLKSRTIDSYIREFEHKCTETEVQDWSIHKISTELWSFFNKKYQDTFAAVLEQEHGKPFDEIIPEHRPGLGLMVGGFSPDQYLCELWDVSVHANSAEDGVTQTRVPGDFGSSWRGQVEGIRRFHKGFSFGHLDSIIQAFLDHYDVKMDDELSEKIKAIVQSAEYVIPWGGMPLQEGIDYVKFCLDIMINQTKFVIGAPTCGGNVRIGVVQRDKGFEFVTDTDFEIRTI